MKPALIRRFRRRVAPAKSEGTFFKKESQETFFGGTEHETFFQPAAAAPAAPQPVQRKCAECEKEDKQLQREPEKKEEEKEVQRAEDKKEDEKVMRAGDKNEEETVQREPEKKEEEQAQRTEDKKEEEEKVMRAEDKKEEEQIQKAEDDKKEEDKTVQKKQNNGKASGTAGTASYVSTLSGKGQALPAAANYFFSSKMGYDFSDVKIHNDKTAAESARNINAKAYTVGNNVVFNEGQYNTTSGEGRHLLAHELTHVIQQDKNANRKIQRKTPTGFDITGVFAGAASFPNTIFYDMGSAMIPPTEWHKLSGIATTFAAKNITLTGTASEEGDPVGNTTLVNTRIAGVDHLLGKHGHKKVRTRNPLPTTASGNIDYRRVRNVEVVETPGVVPPGGVMPEGVPSCEVTVDNPTPKIQDCGTAFDDAFPLALSWAITAYLKVASRDPAALAQIGTIFPGIPVATIETHLRNLIEQIGRLPAQHRCHNECDSVCDRGAYNEGTGSSSMMTLCSAFINSGDLLDNAQTLVHESLHATPGLAADDVAYITTRLIRTLPGAEAVRNTDSYTLLILSLAGVAPIPVPATDTFPGLSIPEKEHAAKVMSFLEQWLLNADSGLTIIYAAMEKNLGSLAGWDADDEWAATVTHEMVGAIGLTDPGASPFATAPKTEDKVKIAGMWDRFTQMMRAVYMTSIEIKKAGGADKWAAAMGPKVELGAAFFGMSVEDGVKHLLKLLILSQGKVPAALINSYIEATDIIRKNHSTGP